MYSPCAIWTRDISGDFFVESGPRQGKVVAFADNKKVEAFAVDEPGHYFAEDGERWLDPPRWAR